MTRGDGRVAAGVRSGWSGVDLWTAGLLPPSELGPLER